VVKPEPRKPGRPKLEEHEAKGKIVPVRFKADEIEKIIKAAKKQNLTVSEWIRSTLASAL
jgi:Holliday junction resolvasome RuvABC DNA-binding subunit